MKNDLPSHTTFCRIAEIALNDYLKDYFCEYLYQTSSLKEKKSEDLEQAKSSLGIEQPMKKEQKLAFEYGQAASMSACPFAPCYDQCMYGLVSEAHTAAAHQRNQENMRAWYMGYRSQTALTGNGISREIFTAALTVLIDSKPESITSWIGFAVECVDLGQYVDFVQKNDDTLNVNRWLETLLSGLLETQKQYGVHIAKQVCDLASQSNCLYPSEMLQAAVYLQKGSTPEEIGVMIASGAIDGEQPFFPKLSDAAEENPDYSPYTSIDLSILGM